jgi:hypothetical protein
MSFWKHGGLRCIYSAYDLEFTISADTYAVFDVEDIRGLFRISHVKHAIRFVKEWRH